MDLLTGIENLSGTAFDDVLVGDGHDNWLYGQVFSSVNASSNGNLQFSSADTAYQNACLPAATRSCGVANG